MREVDAKNQRCPMPIVSLARSMRDLRPGECVRIEANDPVFLADLEAWIKKTKNKLISTESRDGIQIAVVEKI